MGIGQGAGMRPFDAAWLDTRTPADPYAFEAIRRAQAWFDCYLR